MALQYHKYYCFSAISIFIQFLFNLYSISTGHNIKWDHFEILANGRCDLRCTIKVTLLILDLKPAQNENVGSEKILLY